jgi:hypothetical protein
MSVILSVSGGRTEFLGSFLSRVTPVASLLIVWVGLMSETLFKALSEPSRGELALRIPYTSLELLG